MFIDYNNEIIVARISLIIPVQKIFKVKNTIFEQSKQILTK